MATLNTTSFAKTPQAGDDTFTYAEGTLQPAAKPNILLMDVMANDLGGKAKTLYSVDDGSPLTNLKDLAESDVEKDLAGTTQSGALLKIVDGKVQIDLTPALAANGSYKSLDQMGNGTLSWATVNYPITGTNDAPVATFTAAQSATEDGIAISGQLTLTDVDSNATASYALVGSPIAGLTIDSSGSWTFDPMVTAYQSPAEDAKLLVKMTYSVTDEHGATSNESLLITLTGWSP